MEKVTQVKKITKGELITKVEKIKPQTYNLGSNYRLLLYLRGHD